LKSAECSSIVIVAGRFPLIMAGLVADMIRVRMLVGLWFLDRRVPSGCLELSRLTECLRMQERNLAEGYRQ